MCTHSKEQAPGRKFFSPSAPHVADSQFFTVSLPPLEKGRFGFPVDAQVLASSTSVIELVREAVRGCFPRDHCLGEHVHLRHDRLSAARGFRKFGIGEPSNNEPHILGLDERERASRCFFILKRPGYCAIYQRGALPLGYLAFDSDALRVDPLALDPVIAGRSTPSKPHNIPSAESLTRAEVLKCDGI